MLVSAVCDLQCLVNQVETVYAARAGWVFGRREGGLSRARQRDVKFVVWKSRGNSETGVPVVLAIESVGGQPPQNRGPVQSSERT